MSVMLFLASSHAFDYMSVKNVFNDFLWFFTKQVAYMYMYPHERILLDLPTLMDLPWDLRFGVSTHGLTIWPPNLRVNQKILKLQK